MYNFFSPFIVVIANKYIQLTAFEWKFDEFSFLFVGSVSKETPESDNDKTCAELKADEGWKTAQNNGHNNSSRPVSVGSEPEQTINANNVVTPRWVEVISVPLMMAYVTRYIFGTDKLRSNAFEVRGLNNTSTGEMMKR
jgi:gamma-syntrophin